MNQDNYEQIVQYIVTNQNMFYRLAFSYTQNKEDALDIVQNAICKALENYETIRNIEYIRSWFYRVLVNESLIYIKKHNREVTVESDEELDSPYYEKAYEEDDELYDQINKLPIDLQNIIKLFYFEELTLKEIAEVTNTNLNTVKARLYRGLQKLKLELEEVFACTK